ncbi:IS110 family transposase [Nocardia tengchongensis]
MTVIIGMDPHKRTATIEIIDPTATVLTGGRFATDKTGYDEMLTTARRFADRVWAVEGCNGIGRHLAHRLIHDGETVIDVPAKLSAQVRVFATGNGRKTDPVDAHSVALAALRAPNLLTYRFCTRIPRDLYRRFKPQPHGTRHVRAFGGAGGQPVWTADQRAGRGSSVRSLVRTPRSPRSARVQCDEPALLKGQGAIGPLSTTTFSYRIPRIGLSVLHQRSRSYEQRSS